MKESEARIDLSVNDERYPLEITRQHFFFFLTLSSKDLDKCIIILQEYKYNKFSKS